MVWQNINILAAADTRIGNMSVHYVIASGDKGFCVFLKDTLRCGISNPVVVMHAILFAVTNAKSEDI